MNSAIYQSSKKYHLIQKLINTLRLVFLCVSYRAVFEELPPDLHREASSGITGHIRVNYRDVDQSRKVYANRGQMATVCKPWRGKTNVLIDKNYFNDSQIIKDNQQFVVLTSVESTGDYLILHGVTEEL